MLVVDGRGVRASDPVGSTHLVLPPRGSAPRRNRCVDETHCPLCGARQGYLCLGSMGPHWETHVVRRALAKAKRGDRIGTTERLTLAAHGWCA